MKRSFVRSLFLPDLSTETFIPEFNATHCVYERERERERGGGKRERERNNRMLFVHGQRVCF